MQFNTAPKTGARPWLRFSRRYSRQNATPKNQGKEGFSGQRMQERGGSKSARHSCGNAPLSPRRVEGVSSGPIGRKGGSHAQREVLPRVRRVQRGGVWRDKTACQERKKKKVLLFTELRVWKKRVLVVVWKKPLLLVGENYNAIFRTSCEES